MFGAQVRGHRRRLGLTQGELSRITGISERNIRNLENGRIASPRAGTVRLLADAFALIGAERDEFHETAAGQLSEGRPHGDPRPAQLPADVAGFAGRTDQLRRLDDVAGAPAVVITAIGGTAGVGKTNLGM